MALLSRKSSILWAERKADPPTRRVAERRALNRLLRGGNADRCPVCWDTFADIEADGARQVVAAPCGHRFCGACLREAMATACMCPLCKSTRGMRRFVRDATAPLLGFAVEIEHSRACCVEWCAPHGLFGLLHERHRLCAHDHGSTVAAQASSVLPLNLDL